MRKRASRWQTTLAAVVIWGGFCAVNALAEQGPVTPASRHGHSVSEFLTPDGRFDLEAARLSGFEGSLDLDDANLQLDPRTGAPRVRPSSAASPTDYPDDIYWDNSISPSILGINGNVYAATIYDGQLVVGGDFQMAGNALASNIATWNGSCWFPLGEGMEDPVNALTVYDGKLIAGGTFFRAGGVYVGSIASWNGSSWSSLREAFYDVKTGSGQSVGALVVYDGKLIVGGRDLRVFDDEEVINIASWDGSSWSPLGSGLNYYVSTLAVYDGKLIAGGDFNGAGGVPALHIASWDGSNWSPLGSGLDGVALALAVYDGRLIAAGEFDIASWDGSNWSALGTEMGGSDFDRRVSALTEYNGRLIAGGMFTTVSGDTVNRVASWDGSTWSPLGTGVKGSGYVDISVLIEFDHKLIAGGGFASAGDRIAKNIASWDGSSWSPLGFGTSGRVSALTVYDGKLIAGGDFASAGTAQANRIASWDGVTWASLGSGMDSTVLSLTVYDGKLIAGGSFETAGGFLANNVASWDGTNWSPLGAGISGAYSRVLALSVYNGNLIAGGYFSSAGGREAFNIASWDGDNWSVLSSGTSERVNALSVYDGKLIAGGCFTEAGGIEANNIAAWDEGSWSSLGAGMDGPVYALMAHDGKLIAGGDFGTAGGVGTGPHACWNGSTWVQYGYDMYPSAKVHALAVYNGKPIEGGIINCPLGRVALLHGNKWLPLGSGLWTESYWNRCPSVSAITVYNENLIVGGDFTQAGNRVSAYLVQWTDRRFAGPVGNIDMNNVAYEIPDADMFTDYFIEGTSAFGTHPEGSTAASDTNKDNVLLSIADLVYLIRVVAGDYLPYGKVDPVPMSWTLMDGVIAAGDVVGGAALVVDGNVTPQLLASGMIMRFRYDGHVTRIVVVPDVTAGDRYGFWGDFLGSINGKIVSIEMASPGGFPIEAKFMPMDYGLSQNYPNPFNPRTTIEYSVPSRTQVTIEVFNLLGQKVRTLIDETKPGGSYRTRWDGCDDAGQRMSTGVYLYRISAGDFVQTKKMVLLK